MSRATGASGAAATDSRLRFEYFDLGTQYYAAGRFACQGRLIPVAGNLLHHAVEMYVKGCLCDHVSEQRRRSLGHSLPKLLNELKIHRPDPALPHLERIIKELDPFERLRYPEQVRGYTYAISPAVLTASHFDLIPGNVENFVLINIEIDGLVLELHRLGSVTPHTTMLGPEAVRSLKEGNHYADRWK